MPSTFRYARAESGQKYGAKKTEVDGHMFDSKAEAAHYCALKQLEEAGVIRKLELQPKFFFGSGPGRLKIRTPKRPLGRAVTYTGDFSFIYKGKRWIQDVKGMDTDASRLRRALDEYFHGYIVHVVKKTGELPPE